MSTPVALIELGVWDARLDEILAAVKARRATLAAVGKRARVCPDCGRNTLSRKETRLCIDCYKISDSWVDEVVVQRLIGGHRVGSTTAERREAVRRMDVYEYPTGLIAMRLHCTTRAVQRLRKGKTS